MEQLEAKFKLQAERGNVQELETFDPETQESSATALSIGGEAGHSLFQQDLVDSAVGEVKRCRRHSSHPFQCDLRD